MVDGEPFAGAAEAGLDFVGDEDDALVLGPGSKGRQEALGRDDEAALALDGFDDERGHQVPADLLFDHGDGALCGLGAGEVRILLAVRVAHRHAVDLGRERAKAPGRT